LHHILLNECVSRAFSAAGIRIPVKKEPTDDLAHKDGKRPDSCILISWRRAEVNHWLGMVLQSAPQWPIHTWPLQAMQQELSPNKLLTGIV